MTDFMPKNTKMRKSEIKKNILGEYPKMFFNEKMRHYRQISTILT